ncbi:sulfatase [Echinimonas agarilytica]|uniref:Sulfatase n=1 Tax=Echinimonas agarilytica TaxID=1215918 RepID=A0AA41W5P2_9GAMM|nr:sulfatase [Echinimonas agarilytica]MCM2679504.1 sulfatase [Echinimonas agarilytica]
MKKSLGAVTVATALITAPFSAMSAEKPYNVLMIAVDDLNNEVGAWGGKAITPNIDKLAAQGTQFQNGHAVVPACNPSRVAILTGKRPETTKQYTNAGNFRNIAGNEDMVTLPAYLQQQGYNSIAAGKVFHHPRGKHDEPNKYSDDRSWTHQAKVRTGTSGHGDYKDAKGNAKWLNGETQYNGKEFGRYLNQFAVWGPIDTPKEKTGDFETAQYCANFMNSPASHEKPFFLSCGIFRPHSPQLAPREFFDLYPIEDIELPLDPHEDIQDLSNYAKRNFSSPMAEKIISQPEEWKRAIQAYLASTSFADAAIGVMLDALEASPHNDNTIVVLWGDHGWQWGQKLRWEKFSLWSKGTNTPFIIKAPGLAPVIVEDHVSLLDVWPTLMELMDLSTSEKLEGNSLVKLMKNPNAQWEKPAIITYNKGNNSVRYKQWNFIQYKTGGIELYDTSNDPGERTNLATSNAKQHTDIIMKLRAWIPKA